MASKVQEPPRSRQSAWYGLETEDFAKSCKEGVDKRDHRQGLAGEQDWPYLTEEPQHNDERDMIRPL